MEVGNYYKVPCVRVTTWRGFGGWLPIIGPKHEDAEHVNFPYPHFHIDWRFAPSSLWKSYGQDGHYPGGHYGMPIQCPDMHHNKVIVEGPVLRRMKFKRDPGCFPRKLAKWLPALEESMGCQKLLNGLCPHRGIPVSAMRRDGDVLTCPGHGLQWHAITGELIRTPVREQPRFSDQIGEKS